MEPYCCAWAVHIRVVWSGTSRLRPSSVSSPSARAPRFAAMAGRMPAAASRRSRSRGPNNGPTAPAGRSWPDATPRSPRASPTPSGCRGRAARRRIPASSPPGIGPSGSCGGGVRYVCTASAYHRPRPRRRLQQTTPAPPHPARRRIVHQGPSHPLHQFRWRIGRQVNTGLRDDLLPPDATLQAVAGIRLEWWPPSDR